MNAIVLKRLLMLLLVSAFSILFFTVPAYAESAQGKVSSVDGEAWVFEPDTNTWHTLNSSTVLREGDALKVGSGSAVSLRLSAGRDIGTLTIPEDTELYFPVFRHDAVIDNDIVLIYLGKGKIAVALDWLRKDLKFEVKTPTAWMGNRDSTSFEVAVSPELEPFAHPSPAQHASAKSSSAPMRQQGSGGAYP